MENSEVRSSARQFLRKSHDISACTKVCHAEVEHTCVYACGCVRLCVSQLRRWQCIPVRVPIPAPARLWLAQRWAIPIHLLRMHSLACVRPRRFDLITHIRSGVCACLAFTLRVRLCCVFCLRLRSIQRPRLVCKKSTLTILPQMHTYIQTHMRMTACTATPSLFGLYAFCLLWIVVLVPTPARRIQRSSIFHYTSINHNTKAYFVQPPAAALHSQPAK